MAPRWTVVSDSDWPEVAPLAEVMAGAGVKGGQVIGATDAGGVEVVDRRIQVNDLYQSICHGLKLDPDQENTSASGRDLKVVDGGNVVQELFG